MKDKVNDIENLLNRIDLYFECMLSDDEERELRDELTNVSISHPVIDEAKAVMGFKTIIRRGDASGNSRNIFKSHFYLLIKGVAVVAVIISVVATIRFLVIDNAEYAPECIAYINGETITDEEEVMSILQQNIVELDEGLNDCQEEAFSDIDALGAIVDLYDTETDTLDK